MMGVAILGQIWREMICSHPEPAAMAASTYSSSLMERVTPLEIRTNWGAWERPRAMITPFSDGPAITTTTMASIIIGKIKSISVMRITTDSSLPPIKPAIIPTGTPVTNAKSIAAPVSLAVT